MRERLEGTDQYRATVLPLLTAVNIKRWGDFDDDPFDIPEGWEIVGGFRSAFKLKAVHQSAGLFVKLFPPSLTDYTRATIAAFEELAALPLSIPILPLLGSLEQQGITALLFQQGVPLVRDRFGLIYPGGECEMINVVVRKCGLEVLSPNKYVGDRIDIIEIDGHHFAVDPIEDSHNSMFEFLEAHGGRQIL